MPIPQAELDKLKQATADALAKALREHGSLRSSEDVILVTLNAMDAANADPTDPRPFAPGNRVRTTTELTEATPWLGTVVRVVEDAGEIHTVVVHWDRFPGEHFHSPRELADLGAGHAHRWDYPNASPVTAHRTRCLDCNANLIRRDTEYSKLGFIQARDRKDCTA